MKGNPASILKNNTETICIYYIFPLLPVNIVFVVHGNVASVSPSLLAGRTGRVNQVPDILIHVFQAIKVHVLSTSSCHCEEH